MAKATEIGSERDAGSSAKTLSNSLLSENYVRFLAEEQTRLRLRANFTVHEPPYSCKNFWIYRISNEADHDVG